MRSLEIYVATMISASSELGLCKVNHSSSCPLRPHKISCGVDGFEMGEHISHLGERAKNPRISDAPAAYLKPRAIAIVPKRRALRVRHGREGDRLKRR